MNTRTKKMLAVLLALGIAGSVFAEDKPEEVLQAASNVIDDIDEGDAVEEIQKLTLEERWRQYLDAMKLGNGIDEGEVVTFPDRDLIVSSASVFTRVRIGQPGWIESRVAAFEQAELEAKTKIARFLSETVDAERSLEYFEKAAWSDGSVEEMQDINDVSETLKRIGKKSLALTEAGLDKALEKLNEDYDPAEYENLKPEDLKTVVKNRFQRKIRSMALRMTIGITPVYSTEGEVEGEYQVLVGMIWSPKLNQLALNLFNEEYNIPAVSPQAPLTDQVPTQDEILLGTWGTRVVIDENGDYAVLSFAQAQPRKAPSARQQAALQVAKQIAAERARAQLVNYIREGLVMRSVEESQELSREFSDSSLGTETLRDYEKKIKGSKTKVRLRGVKILKEWSLTHPQTSQKVAGVVIAWSPASARTSEQMSETMESAAKGMMEKKHEELSPEDAGDAVLESMPVNPAVY